MSRVMYSVSDASVMVIEDTDDVKVTRLLIKDGGTVVHTFAPHEAQDAMAFAEGYAFCKRRSHQTLTERAIRKIRGLVTRAKP